MVDQDLLRQLHRDRLRACGRGLPSAAEPECSVVVVLAGFDPATFVTGALAFAANAPPERASAWARAYTRTVFLAGNPANLRARFSFTHTSADGRVAWLGPAARSEHYGLQRLLRAFSGTRLRLQSTVDVLVPGGSPTGTTYDLYVPAVESVVRYLVDVHHTAAEAYLGGVLRPGDRLRLRHVRSLDAIDVRPEYARVMPTPGDPATLRPLTWLAAAREAA